MTEIVWWCYTVIFYFKWRDVWKVAKYKQFYKWFFLSANLVRKCLNWNWNWQIYWANLPLRLEITVSNSNKIVTTVTKYWKNINSSGISKSPLAFFLPIKKHTISVCFLTMFSICLTLLWPKLIFQFQGVFFHVLTT